MEKDREKEIQIAGGQRRKHFKQPLTKKKKEKKDKTQFSFFSGHESDEY
jgi:hypothetical protein